MLKNGKNLTFFKTNCQKTFFQKMTISGNILKNILIIFLKKRIFGNLLTFKWQFSGGSDGGIGPVHH